MLDTLAWTRVNHMNKVVRVGVVLAGGLGVMPILALAFDTADQTRGAFSTYPTLAQSAMNLQVDDFFAPYGVSRAHYASGFPFENGWPRSATAAPDVVTLGYAWRQLRVEGSVSNERRMHQKEVHFSTGKPFGLSSSLLSFNSSSNLTLQVRRGRLKRFEQIDPDEDVKRTMISAIYQYPLGRNQWQTMLSAGRSRKKADGNASSAYVVESLFQLHRVHTFFGRAERTTADELFRELDTLRGRNFVANRYTLGYVYNMAAMGPFNLILGGLVTKRTMPADQIPMMGKDPVAGKVFVRLSIEMQ